MPPALPSSPDEQKANIPIAGGKQARASSGGGVPDIDVMPILLGASGVGILFALVAFVFRKRGEPVRRARTVDITSSVGPLGMVSSTTSVEENPWALNDAAQAAKDGVGDADESRL